ncbi:MAG: hypothetical protein QM714_02865 [Nocardioides sp.]|uniref:hypothetical protein n=1 Tax=Nocardioides sp. TaxID=35761 RepID=UPI0039E32FD1
MSEQRSPMADAAAAQIRAERAALDIEATDLVERSGLPLKEIAAMEAAEAIDLAKLEIVADALGITVSEFWRRAERRLPSPPPFEPHQQSAIGVAGAVHADTVNIGGDMDNSRSEG